MTKNRNKKPWPTQKVMIQVYEKKFWGEGEGKFYSGDGSRFPCFVDPYIEKVKAFLNSFPSKISVCDLGFGDFFVGNQLVDSVSEYFAIDIVPDLIEENKEKYKSSNVSFQCLNVAEDDLPKADCVIIRQVFQHLSNKEIQAVLNKLGEYKYLLLTEHIPASDFEPNVDIVSGRGIRLAKKSGVDILANPFVFSFKNQEEVLSINDEKWGGKIITKLYSI